MRNAYKILVGKLEGRDYLEGLGIDGKIILEWILRCGLDVFGSW
jgi:hypothetical protein